MHGLLLTPILIILIALAACSDPAPTPEAAVTPVPRTVAATPAPPSNTVEKEGANPAATPASTATPTLEPTSTPVPPGVLPPLPAQDREAVISSLSDTELICIAGDPDRVIATLTGDTQTAKPQSSRTGDGWFAFNLATNLAQM